jgi:hypothetical protein
MATWPTLPAVGAAPLSVLGCLACFVVLPVHAHGPVLMGAVFIGGEVVSLYASSVTTACFHNS